MCSCNFTSSSSINYCIVFDFELSIIYRIIYTHIMDEFIYFTIISILKCLFLLKVIFCRSKYSLIIRSQKFENYFVVKNV